MARHSQIQVVESWGRGLRKLWRMVPFVKELEIQACVGLSLS